MKGYFWIWKATILRKKKNNLPWTLQKNRHQMKRSSFKWWNSTILKQQRIKATNVPSFIQKKIKLGKSLYVQLWLKWKQFQFLRKYKWLVFIYERVFYKTHKNCHFSYCCTFEMAISIHLQTNKSTSQLYSFLYMELIFRGKCGLRRSLAYFCHQALLSSFLRNQKNSKTSYLVNLGTCGTDQV